MADNTRLKEITAELRRQADVIEQSDAANTTRFARLEEMQKASDDRFNEMSSNVAQMMQMMQQFTVTHGGKNSGFGTGTAAVDMSSTIVSPGGTKASTSVGSTTSTQSPFQVRHIKLEFPRFNGKNVLDWIFKAEQFFGYYNTPDPERLIIASVHLEQEVVPWFQMVTRARPFQSWMEFTRALELDFGPSLYDCPRASLFKLNQKKSINEYFLEFTALSNRVYGLSNDALVDCFVSGLKDEIRRDVMLHTPTSIVKAVSLAKVFEEKIEATAKQNLYHRPSTNRAPFNPTKIDQTLVTEKAPNPPLLSTPLHDL